MSALSVVGLLCVAALIVVTAVFMIARIRASYRTIALMPDDVVRVIDRFLSAVRDSHEWDDVISSRIADSDLYAVRHRCARCDWSSELGRAQLQAEADRLRAAAR